MMLICHNSHHIFSGTQFLCSDISNSAKYYLQTLILVQTEKLSFPKNTTTIMTNYHYAFMFYLFEWNVIFYGRKLHSQVFSYELYFLMCHQLQENDGHYSIPIVSENECCDLTKKVYLVVALSHMKCAIASL